MQYPLATCLAVAFTSAAMGCSAALPPKPAGLPPTPRTVTVENPGGDAADPEWAALERLAGEPWGLRRDRTNSILIPLVDARHWQRVRLWGHPTRAAFRFGDDHYGVVALWYIPTTEANDPESCLSRFVAEARPVAEAGGAKVLSSHLVHTVQQGSFGLLPMVVQVIDADVDGIFSSNEYKGALASYPSWPGTCLIQGFVVVAGKHKELATRIRDRWVTEGAPRLSWNGRLMEPPAFEDR